MNQAIEQKDWNPYVMAAFRFAAAYLFLYVLKGYQSYIYNGNIWEAPIIWAGKLLITPDYTVAAYPGGSGDTTYNYLEIFCIFVSSFLLAIVWWILDRRRRNYDQLLYWLMVVLRYTLASALITYGSIKIFKSQFSFPSALKLDASVGDLTPMGLAWVFMGYSTGYNLFMGLAEALAGFLLFFRRTRVLGCLLSITVLGNIIALNVFYDICVKLYSLHLLAMAIFIMLPDLSRLIRFFLLDQAVPAGSNYHPVYRKKWMRASYTILKTMLIAYLVIGQLANGRQGMHQYGDKRPKPPLYGHYRVETFVLNRDTLAPLLTDTIRWNKLFIGSTGNARIEGMTGRTMNWQFNADTVNRSMLAKWGTDSALFYYSRPDKDHLELNGKFFKTTVGKRYVKDSISVRMKKKDLNEYTLINHVPHWVNDTIPNW